MTDRTTNETIVYTPYSNTDPMANLICVADTKCIRQNVAVCVTFIDNHMHGEEWGLESECKQKSVWVESEWVRGWGGEGVLMLGTDWGAQQAAICYKL